MNSGSAQGRGALKQNCPSGFHKEIGVGRGRGPGLLPSSSLPWGPFPSPCLHCYADKVRGTRVDWMQIELSLHLLVYSLPGFVLFVFIPLFSFLDSPCFILANELINGIRDSGQEGGLLCGEPHTSKGHPSPSGSPFGFLLPQHAGKKCPSC